MIIKGKDYVIDPDNFMIRDFDKIYCGISEKILNNGEVFENRTGINTRSIFGECFKLDVGKEFPILESKKVAIYNALSELLWIYQAQSNEVAWLKERGNKIWNEWMIDDDGIYRIYDPYVKENDGEKVVVKDLDGKPALDENGNIMYAKSLYEDKKIKEAKFFGREYAGTIGTAYGWILHEYQRLQQLINTLKTNPHDRRMNIILWQDAHIKTAVLPSCVWSTEWKVTGNKLNCMVHQRSADVPLGLPFNVSQYALLLALVAKVTGFEIGELAYTISDVHIYEDQVDGIRLQLERFKKMKYWENQLLFKSDSEIQAKYNSLVSKYNDIINSGLSEKFSDELNELKENITILELMVTKEKPILDIRDCDNFFEFDNSFNLDKEYLKENATGNKDIKVLKYKSAPFIKMPVAQ